MALATIRFLSPALGRYATYSAIVPDGTAPPQGYPVILQLHGASDDHRSWIERSSLVERALDLGAIIVLPDGGLSYWANLGPRERYEDFVISDLLPHVAHILPARPGTAAIGGLSMGGFGALYLAARHPDRFASAWAHSAPLCPGELDELEARHDTRLVDELRAAIDRLKATTIPVLGFDCGRDDPLLQGNRDLHERLGQNGLAHTYREHPGGHTWAYWNAHMPDAIAQHVRALGASTAGGESIRPNGGEGLGSNVAKN